MSDIRVRFAPSPTGPLHIGGVRTALFNYLFAKRHGGSFILRIEDTDRKRYVPNAEDYINEALEWLGITPDEGVKQGGDYGPYRQSDRKQMYQKFALQLVESGHAYYAFDTAAQLDTQRQKDPHFKYSAANRMQMNNSLTQPESVTEQFLKSGQYVIRIKLPEDQKVIFSDIIRGQVVYNTADMDDKVLFKGDQQMPTYHMANVVDDYHMKISHVIRGEEWLPSTPLHVIMYDFLGWADAMPQFAHLPLILKPVGDGKLSKRDGAKFDMPVFPLDYSSPNKPEEKIDGFREWGFEAPAVLNFLALLGWHPSHDQETFSLEELTQAFSFDGVSKSGARFDFDKAKWFNQQYIMAMSNAEIAKQMQSFVKDAGYTQADDLSYLQKVAELLKERVVFIADMPKDGAYFFEHPDLEVLQEKEGKNLKKKVLKKWSVERSQLFSTLAEQMKTLQPFDREANHKQITNFMEQNKLGFGDVLPLFRLALSGSMQGPDVFKMIEILGKEVVLHRLHSFLRFCDKRLDEY